MKPNEVNIGRLYGHRSHSSAKYVGAQNGHLFVIEDRSYDSDSVGQKVIDYSTDPLFWSGFFPLDEAPATATGNSPSAEQTETQDTVFPREDYERDRVIEEAAERVRNVYPYQPTTERLADILRPFFQTAVVDRDIKIQNLYAALDRKDAVIAERRSELNSKVNEIFGIKGEIERLKKEIGELKAYPPVSLNLGEIESLQKEVKRIAHERDHWISQYNRKQSTNNDLRGKLAETRELLDKRTEQVNDAVDQLSKIQGILNG